ncbi:MAG: GspH/FimT family pseudopilin [Burkholderiaceae bacterium]
MIAGSPRCRPRACFGFPSGYSIVELMTVLTIAAIFLAIGVPAFQGLLDRMRIAAAANDFFAAVTLTRSEAIRRGRRMDLLPADGRDWKNGWMILVDANLNQKADAGEEVVLAHGPVHADIQIRHAFTDTKSLYLTYTPSGRTRTAANSQAAQTGSWEISLNRQTRRIVINFLGRPRMCTPMRKTATC